MGFHQPTGGGGKTNTFSRSHLESNHPPPNFLVWAQELHKLFFVFGVFFWGGSGGSC